MVDLKYLRLIAVRKIHNLIHKLPAIVSYFFLVFSVISCSIILFSNYFDRVPALSYYIREQELPITYTLTKMLKYLLVGIVYFWNQNILI